jgi:hypothetical protein
MSPETMMIIAAPVVLYGLLAFILKRPVLMRTAILALSLVILMREIAIYSYPGRKLGDLAEMGLLTEQFADGARLMSDYCRDTRVLALLALLLIMMLGYRNARRKDAEATAAHVQTAMDDGRSRRAPTSPIN